VPIVLDHLGAPLDVGPYAGRRDGVLTVWRAAIKGVAACRNVFMKLGRNPNSRHHRRRRFQRPIASATSPMLSIPAIVEASRQE
jgi:predicted TIM-barrel fold metal-dependent hydrolase